MMPAVTGWAKKRFDDMGSPLLEQLAFAGFVAGAESIAQFMDRDTRPDFASTVMIPAIQQFLGNPDDIDGLTRSIESQKQSIFTT